MMMKNDDGEEENVKENERKLEITKGNWKKEWEGKGNETLTKGMNKPQMEVVQSIVFKGWLLDLFRVNLFNKDGIFPSSFSSPSQQHFYILLSSLNKPIDRTRHLGQEMKSISVWSGGDKMFIM